MLRDADKKYIFLLCLFFLNKREGKISGTFHVGPNFFDQLQLFFLINSMVRNRLFARYGMSVLDKV